MEILNKLSAYFNVVNELININKADDGYIWFSIGDAEYTAKLNKNKTDIKANSVRKA